MIIKKSGLENTGISDPETQRQIRVSTTVRINYRFYFDSFYQNRDDYTSLRNKELNEIIAKDFAASAGGVRHMFPAGSSDIQSKSRDWIEVRKVAGRRAFHFFFAIYRSGSIDIIGTSTRYHKPKSPTLRDSPRLTRGY